MKKILLLAATVFFILNKAHSQSQGNEAKIGLGIDFAFPLENYKNTADYGAGVSLLYQKPVADHLNITVNVGYLRFNGPGVFSNIKYKEGFVPIKAGARYFIVKNFYGSGELGIAISTANGSGTGTAFAYAPSLGMEFPVSNGGSIDLGFRYERWSRSSGAISFAGIRAGYNF